MADKFKIGTVVFGQALKKHFGPHFQQVLSESLERQEKTAKGEKAKFKIMAALPATVVDYNTLRNRLYTMSAADLVADAYSEIEILAEEMRDAFDNMPESLQGGDLGQRREEAADALENVNKPDCPDGCDNIFTVFLPSTKENQSRADRAGEVVSMLNEAISAIREHAEELESNKGEETASTEGSVETEVDVDELLTFADDLDETISEVESVEFPGMYS